jgi:hypothetical protein
MVIFWSTKYRTYTLASGQTINIPRKFVSKSVTINSIKDFDRSDNNIFALNHNIFTLSIIFEVNTSVFYSALCNRRNIDPSQEECLDEFIYTNFMYSSYLMPYMNVVNQLRYYRYVRPFLSKSIEEIFGIKLLKYHDKFDTDFGLDGKDINLPNPFRFYKECNKFTITLEDERDNQDNEYNDMFDVVKNNNEKLKSYEN